MGLSASKGRGVAPTDVTKARSGMLQLRVCIGVSPRLSVTSGWLQNDDEQDVKSAVGAVEVDESGAFFLVKDDAFFFFNAIAFL